MRISDWSSDVCSSDLTEALKQKVVNQTALGLTNNGGDAIFEGTVTGFTVQPVAMTGGETAELTRLNVSISVKYTNTIDPKQSFESSFTRYRDFLAGQNLQTVQNNLIEEIMPELVDDIFNRALARKSTRLNSRNYCAYRMTSSD